MSSEKVESSKRKSTDSTEQLLKKVKVAKSADRPQPVKSALKGAKAAKNAKQAGKKTLPAPEQSDDEHGVADSALTPDQTAALLAGFSSSDEEEDDEAAEEAGKDDGIALDKLPRPPLPQDGSELLALTGTTNNSEADPESSPGVVYIGRLPHGFYERQMRAYFSQFGEITHLKMPRNKKTGRSKHYAFIEFASAAVAEIVTKTMDKYLLFNHILRVQSVAREHVKDGMWKGEGRRKRPMPRNKIEGAKLNKGTDAGGWTRRIGRENERRKSKADKLKELGYEFHMPEVKGIPAVPALDTPTLEREAEQQLLGDIEHAADEQSNEVELQPETVEQPGEKSKKRAASSTRDNRKVAKKTKSKKS